MKVIHTVMVQQSESDTVNSVMIKELVQQSESDTYGDVPSLSAFPALSPGFTFFVR